MTEATKEIVTITSGQKMFGLSHHWQVIPLTVTDVKTETESGWVYNEVNLELDKEHSISKENNVSYLEAQYKSRLTQVNLSQEVESKKLLSPNYIYFTLKDALEASAKYLLLQIDNEQAKVNSTMASALSTMKISKSENLQDEAFYKDLAKKQKPFTLAGTPILLRHLEKCIAIVEEEAKEAGESSQGFVIDSSFCDHNGIDTGNLVGVIDDFGLNFGEHFSGQYNIAVDELCGAICEHFSK